MLSVVVPSYNCRALVLSSCERLVEFLRAQFERFEVIVVDDGSRPAERVDEEELPNGVSLLRFEQNRGKGAAVRAGMLRARGGVRVFTDVDLPYALDALQQAYTEITDLGAHAVFGDRGLAGSSAAVATPAHRRVTSWALRKLVASFVFRGIGDTQCGLKAFSGALADALFPVLEVDGFGFDVEVYYVLSKHGIPVRKMPVRLVNRGDSSVSPVLTGVRVGGAIVSLPVHRWLGRYDSPALRALGAR